MTPFSVRGIAAFLTLLFAFASPIVAGAAPDNAFYLTDANLPDPNLFIRIDRPAAAVNGVQAVTVVQGGCYFNGRGLADAPRWKMSVRLKGHAPLRKGDFFLVAFNPQRGWRSELRRATPTEVEHYINCDWPRGQFAFQSTNIIVPDSIPLGSAMTIQKVIRVSPAEGGARVAQVIQGPCPRQLQRAESPMTTTYVPSKFGLPNVGDVLVPAGSIESYELMSLLRPSYRKPTREELAHYEACDWPSAMKQP